MTHLTEKARALGLPETGNTDAPSFTLCADPPGCCPVVTELADGGMRLEDEGHVIVLTPAQRALLRQIA